VALRILRQAVVVVALALVKLAMAIMERLVLELVEASAVQVLVAMGCLGAVAAA
jgi:hypothetical protein